MHFDYIKTIRLRNNLYAFKAKLQRKAVLATFSGDHDSVAFYTRLQMGVQRAIELTCYPHTPGYCY